MRDHHLDENLSGKAPWKVVLGAFCLTVSVYGLLSSVGLFQTYWKKDMLKESSRTDVAWIISAFGSFDNLMGAPAGVLYDRHGISWLLPLSSYLYVASFVAMTFCTNYAQFLGCMIVAGAAACKNITAIPSTVAFSICSQWFKSKAALATGCVSLGTALGGIFFSLTNLPQTTSETGEESKKTATLWDVAKSPKFWLIAYPIFAYELVLFIQWGSIPSYAEAVNYGENQFYLMMSYNITLPMWLSDRKLGPINSLIMMNLFTLGVVLVIWLPLGSRSIYALFAVVVLMGVGTGSAVPLGDSFLGTLTDQLVTRRVLIGNPAVEALLERFGSDGLVAFLGALLFTAMTSMSALRWLCNDRRWTLMVKI
ncbi:putative transporter [Podospora fimiseda]|uniref:Transporter n=1 Tax=Podospora fimiseda TaxID=252190 RepID=A0AAN7BWT7_9PEZI|nr:putative transporter [Podospora fimiseda]